MVTFCYSRSISHFFPNRPSASTPIDPLLNRLTKKAWSSDDHHLRGLIQQCYTFVTIASRPLSTKRFYLITENCKLHTFTLAAMDKNSPSWNRMPKQKKTSATRICRLQLLYSWLLGHPYTITEYATSPAPTPLLKADSKQSKNNTALAYNRWYWQEQS